jgi:hypothetical protein
MLGISYAFIALILTDEEHVRTGTSLRLLLDLLQAHLASIYHKCERKKRGIIFKRRKAR